MKNITKNILLIGNNNRVHGDLFHCLTGVQDADRGIFKLLKDKDYPVPVLAVGTKDECASIAVNF